MSGQHDNLRQRILFHEQLEYFEAIRARHVQVGDAQFKLARIGQTYRHFRIIRAGYYQFVTKLAAQNLADQLADSVVVIDDERSNRSVTVIHG